MKYYLLLEDNDLDKHTWALKAETLGEAFGEATEGIKSWLFDNERTSFSKAVLVQEVADLRQECTKALLARQIRHESDKRLKMLAEYERLKRELRL